jgi:eukaryotic-like serine/threonine-protein kinase
MSEPGDVIGGRFEVLRAIGRGSFGTTYEVRDVVLGGTYALKLGDNVHDRRAGDRILLEASALKTLHHPNIVKLVDVGLFDERHGLLMELVRGPTLGDLIADGPIPLPAVLETAIAIGRALRHAHQHAFIHQDVTPWNIFIPRGPGDVPCFRDALLADFGLARTTEEGTPPKTVIVGTLRYMPPEQLHGGPVTTRADIFSLGAVIYEMLFRDGPYGRGSVTGTLLTIWQGAVDVPQTRPDVPRALTTLLQRMLQREPMERPNSMSDVLEILEHIQARSEPRTSRWLTLTSPWPVLRQGVVRAASVGLLAAASITAFALFRHAPGATRAATLLVLGAGGGLAAAAIARAAIARRRGALDRQAGLLLGRAGDRQVLSRSLAIDVDQMIEACRRMDQRIFAQSLALMMTEYEVAKDSGDRQAALMNAVALLEKLLHRLSPWHVRHEKLIAVVISVVGTLAGAVSAAAALIGKR